jgi:3-oxoacyl-[acyl-carrier-protein] synthase-3
MTPVYITRLSKFFPNDPVSNDEMESVLGMIGGKPSRARNLILRNNGIKKRYYAINEGRPTHTNAQLAAVAIRELFDEKHPAEKLELLAVGTTSPEQILPSHAAMVHGELGLHPLEIVSASGACASSMQAFKYAFMAVASGLVKMAATAGSERFSAWTNASRYAAEAENWKQLDENPYIAFEKDFLRWMLSDGAGAALLENKPNEEGWSLRIEWLEILSYANELETCMYAGAVKNGDSSITGWTELSAHEWADQSVFSYKQDTRLLGENIIRRGGAFLKQLKEKYGLKKEDVDYFLPHMSSEFFRQQIYDYMAGIDLEIPYDKWFYNLTTVGNVGSASPFLMLEELVQMNKIKKGERILLMVPESARFSYAYMYLTVV